MGCDVTERRSGKWREREGQASLEAAFLIPVALVLLLLLLQPGIVLYDRVIMRAAAAEACRLLATKTDVAGDMQASCEAFVLHRLGAVPQAECFHVHDGGCTWDILLEGDETSGSVSVCIENQLRPLPLVGAAAGLLGLTNGSGNIELRVKSQAQTQPSWVAASEKGLNPAQWVGAWLE